MVAEIKSQAEDAVESIESRAEHNENEYPKKSQAERDVEELPRIVAVEEAVEVVCKLVENVESSSLVEIV